MGGFYSSFLSLKRESSRKDRRTQKQGKSSRLRKGQKRRGRRTSTKKKWVYRRRGGSYGWNFRLEIRKEMGKGEESGNASLAEGGTSLRGKERSLGSQEGEPKS